MIDDGFDVQKEPTPIRPGVSTGTAVINPESLRILEENQLKNLFDRLGPLDGDNVLRVASSLRNELEGKTKFSLKLTGNRVAKPELALYKEGDDTSLGLIVEIDSPRTEELSTNPDERENIEYGLWYNTIQRALTNSPDTSGINLEAVDPSQQSEGEKPNFLGATVSGGITGSRINFIFPKEEPTASNELGTVDITNISLEPHKR